MEPTEILQRPYSRLLIPDESGSYTAEIFEFPGCMAVGATAAEALENLEEVAIDWVAAALEQGQDIPEPMEATDYSGKLVLRMPSGLHKRAAMCAEREGASLNQFIVTCLAEAIGERARQRPVIFRPQFQAIANSIVFQRANNLLGDQSFGPGTLTMIASSVPQYEENTHA